MICLNILWDVFFREKGLSDEERLNALLLIWETLPASPSSQFIVIILKLKTDAESKQGLASGGHQGDVQRLLALLLHDQGLQPQGQQHDGQQSARVHL